MKKRHQIRLLRPPTGLDELGRTTGEPTEIVCGVPVEIEALRGAELAVARQTMETAEFKAIFRRVDPSWNMSARDMVEWFDGFTTRTLHLQEPPRDPDGTGANVSVYLGELPP